LRSFKKNGSQIGPLQFKFAIAKTDRTKPKQNEEEQAAEAG